MTPQELSKISNEDLVKFFKSVNQCIGKTGDPFPKGPHDPKLLENEIFRRLSGEPFKTLEDYNKEILDEMHS